MDSGKYLSDLDFTKERAFNFYYAPKGASGSVNIEKAQLIACNWRYRSSKDVLITMIGATAGARLKYKTGFIMAMDVEKKVIVKIIRI